MALNFVWGLLCGLIMTLLIWTILNSIKSTQDQEFKQTLLEINKNVSKLMEDKKNG